MTDAMSKKERLARGSAVIKVMKVIPRAGHFLKTYLDPHKMPKKPKPAHLKGVLSEMPHLDVKNATYDFSPKSAKVSIASFLLGGDGSAECSVDSLLAPEQDPRTIGLPEGDKMLDWFNYRSWVSTVSPASNNNLAEHFNIMLGLLISMAEDSNNENFADIEAYPACQFLRTVKSPDGDIPYNCQQFLSYIEYVAQKMLDEG